MATLTQRTEAVEERIDSLETILARFMTRTDAAIDRLESIVERSEHEGTRDREAAARDRESAGRDRESAARDREESGRDREESARFREALARGLEAREQQAARERQEMNKRWGELANKMGTVVEDIVAPSIRRLAREVFDCGELRQFWTRMSASRSDDPSRTREFDALYVGTRAVLLNETKSSPRASDARRFAAFLESGELACYFPEYRKLPIVAAFSSLSIPDDLVTYLTRRGIYAIAMGDEAMQVLNLDAVRSRTAAPGVEERRALP